jgi:superfamily I DNA/RNA helicase
LASSEQAGGFPFARMQAGGRGLTVVGDDAQSIYSFCAATKQELLVVD